MSGATSSEIRVNPNREENRGKQADGNFEGDHGFMVPRAQV